MATQIEIKWQPNIADAKVGLALGAWGSVGRVTRTALLLFVFPSAAFVWLLLQNVVPPIATGTAVILGVGAGLLFGALFLPMFGTLFARKLVKLQLAQGENQIIAISEEGVERRSATTVVCHPWSAVSRVDELPLSFLLVSGSTAIGSIEKSGISSTVIIIPSVLVLVLPELYARMSM